MINDEKQSMGSKSVRVTRFRLFRPSQQKCKSKQSKFLPSDVDVELQGIFVFSFSLTRASWVVRGGTCQDAKGESYDCSQRNDDQLVLKSLLHRSLVIYLQYNNNQFTSFQRKKGTLLIVHLINSELIFHQNSHILHLRTASLFRLVTHYQVVFSGIKSECCKAYLCQDKTYYNFLLTICKFSDQYQQYPYPSSQLNNINQLQQIPQMPKSTKLPKSPQQRQSLLQSLSQQISRLRQLQPNPDISTRLTILTQRVSLISSIKQYSQPRLGNLQRLLKHYSTNIFRPGVKYDFDQIKYNNEHLIVQRFLAFIKDFGLNEIQVNGEVKNIVEPRVLALLFKTCSKDSRNVDLTEFILLLEKLFVLLFNENQDYAKKQRQLRQEKREKRREAREREIKRLEKIQARLGPQIAPKQGANGGAKKAASPTKQKPKSLIKKKTQLQDLQPAPKQLIIDTESQVLYQITDQEKIESYMIRIGIDDRKEMQKKLRAFSKADYKYYETQDLERFKPSKNQKEQDSKPVQVVKKKQEQNNQRLKLVKEKVIKRQIAINKHLLSKSLAKAEGKSTMRKNSLDQLTLKPPREEGLHFSLQMLAHSSPGQLPLQKILPSRLISPDPTDHIYLRQFGLTSRNNRSHSNAEMIKRTKQLAVQLQTQEANHLNRYTNNVMPNQQYLKKFLQQRKW